MWARIDLAVVPIVTMCFFLSFLDKGNIGNARLAGLQKDLEMSDYQYTIMLTITFIPYILAELPSNLWLTRTAPNIVLPAMTTLWGIAATLQGVVTSYGGLVACRFFIGLFEGGLSPGIMLYLTTFYPLEKLQLRISLFFVATSLAGAFSGLLASAIIHMDGVGGKPGWAWIFILEGLFTFLFGICAFFLLPRKPASLAFLSPHEKEYVENELRAHDLANNPHSAKSGRGGIKWEQAFAALRAVRVWIWVVAGFFNGATLSGLSYFLPSIVASLGYTADDAQLMSVPPFAASFVLSIFSSYLSDKYNKRSFTVFIFAIVGIIGFAMFVASSAPHTRYAALFFILPGTYCMAPPLAALAAITPRRTHASQTGGPYAYLSHTTRATSIALLTISTNSGGILSTWLLGALSKGPRYEAAGWVFGAFQVGIVVCAAVSWIYGRK
ncbi:MFS general substrate transporter [Trametopsis cervina]|nr:MFS general substrate transporter [Trametopsis cervina]